MVTLRLLTDASALIGLLAFAGPEAIGNSPPLRDCGFTPAPQQVEHELTAVVVFAAGRTYRCKLQAGSGATTILAHIHEGMTVVVRVGADGRCEWHVEKLFGRSATTGRCALAD